MAQTNVIEEGTTRIREAFESLEDEVQRVQKELRTRRTKFEKRLTQRRKQIEKRFEAQRKQIEKRTNKLRAEIEKNPTVKRLNSLRQDARESFEQGVSDLLGTLSIASSEDVKKVDRKLSQLSRKLREIEKAAN